MKVLSVKDYWPHFFIPPEAGDHLLDLGFWGKSGNKYSPSLSFQGSFNLHILCLGVFPICIKLAERKEYHLNQGIHDETALKRRLSVFLPL